MAGRPQRQRKQRGASLRGRRYEVIVGPVAHGGHFVARIAELDDRVVFVRHALTGERVIVEITEGTEGDRFLRGDAVEILEAVEGRVEAPCAVARPGGCGGCDFQHIEIGVQRQLKTDVVLEQLRRVAKLDDAHPAVRSFSVAAVPGDEEGLRWRTRSTFVTDRSGRRGMRRHRSHSIVEVDDCLIARRDARQPGTGPGVVQETVIAEAGTHVFDVAADSFWQVHPGAPKALVDAVLFHLAPEPGEKALDLYSGVGLFSAYLADAVGETGGVVAIEGSASAVEHAADNLAGRPGVRVFAGEVGDVLAHQEIPADIVVLDPPRIGAKRVVVDQIVRREPRAVALVACDPAAMARDIALFREAGYELVHVQGFDLFPMTHHVECVALLTRTGSDLG